MTIKELARAIIWLLEEFLNYYFSAIKLGSPGPVMTVVQRDRVP